MSGDVPSLKEIFENDTLGILEVSAKSSRYKSEIDRIVEGFEEINNFFDEHQCEPSSDGMVQYTLKVRLDQLRDDEEVKKQLKERGLDRHNLLGDVVAPETTLDEIFESGSSILSSDVDLSIFKFRHIPKSSERAKTDFVAQRKAMGDREFAPYERMFRRVHQEINEGRRSIEVFRDPETQLKEKCFYLIDGVMIYLETIGVDARRNQNLSYNTTRRKDSRTKVIFENGVLSNMYYRSVAKAIYAGGSRMISDLRDAPLESVFQTQENISDEDEGSGWVYVLKSKSQDPQLRDIENLYKIGYSSTPVEQRIKNAKNEATYLFDDVKIVNTYEIYNLNARKFEKLLHKIFGKVCLDIEFETPSKIRVNPREWFVVPKEVIEQAISLIASDEILNFEYDPDSQRLVRKQ